MARLKCAVCVIPNRVRRGLPLRFIVRTSTTFTSYSFSTACLICGLFAQVATLNAYAFRLACWCVLFSVISGLMMTFVCLSMIASRASVLFHQVRSGQDLLQAIPRHQQRPVLQDVPRIKLRDGGQSRTIDIPCRSLDRLIVTVQRQQAAPVDPQRLEHL